LLSDIRQSCCRRTNRCGRYDVDAFLLGGAWLGRRARVSDEFRSTTSTSIRGGDCEDQIFEKHENATYEPNDGQVAGFAQPFAAVEGCSIITREVALDNVDGIGSGGGARGRRLMLQERAVPRCDHHPPWHCLRKGGMGARGSSLLGGAGARATSTGPLSVVIFNYCYF
jgi:hypothetical protein